METLGLCQKDMVATEELVCKRRLDRGMAFSAMQRSSNAWGQEARGPCRHSLGAPSSGTICGSGVIQVVLMVVLMMETHHQMEFPPMDAHGRMTVGLKVTRDDPFGVAPLVQSACWLLGRMPGLVREEHRAGLVAALEDGDVEIAVRGGRTQKSSSAWRADAGGLSRPLRRKRRDA